MEHARSVNESRRDALVGAVLLAAVLLTAAVSAGDGRAQSGGDDPGVDVRFVALDTLHLPPVGRVAGITWMGPDTLAVIGLAALGFVAVFVIDRAAHRAER